MAEYEHPSQYSEAAKETQNTEPESGMDTDNCTQASLVELDKGSWTAEYSYPSSDDDYKVTPQVPDDHPRISPEPVDTSSPGYLWIHLTDMLDDFRKTGVVDRDDPQYDEAMDLLMKLYETKKPKIEKIESGEGASVKEDHFFLNMISAMMKSLPRK